MSAIRGAPEDIAPRPRAANAFESRGLRSLVGTAASASLRRPAACRPRRTVLGPLRLSSCRRSRRGREALRPATLPLDEGCLSFRPFRILSGARTRPSTEVRPGHSRKHRLGLSPVHTQAASQLREAEPRLGCEHKRRYHVPPHETLVQQRMIHRSIARAPGLKEGGPGGKG